MLHSRHQSLRLIGLFRKVLVVDDSALIPAWWQRYSQRRGAEPIPMAGWVGPLRLAGRLDALIPFLAIAATCNAGSHAALGLGWYDLAAG